MTSANPKAKPLRLVDDTWRALSRMDVHLFDAMRLADAIGEMQLSYHCAPDFLEGVTVEQWQLVVETLQDRLRLEIRTAKKIFDSAGRDESEIARARRRIARAAA